MKFRLSHVVAVLCLSTMIFGARPGSAEPPAASQPAWLTQMLADGWQQVEEGVLQRSKGGGRMETFTYGKKGLRWRVDRLDERISRLEDEYGRGRDENLGRVISRLKHDRNDAQSRLVASAPETEPYAVIADTGAGCDFSFGAHTAADPLSGAAGVTATASAYFHGTCGYVGDTYAYTYARATAGTVTTTKTQEDPKYGGTWFDSSATSSANGNLDCYSEAYAHVVSTTVGIDYSTTDTNYLCPATPPTAAINTKASGGSQTIALATANECKTITWTGSATGGTSPYTFDWYIGTAYQGSGASLAKQFCGPQTITVKLVVTDSLGMTDDATYSTSLTYTAAPPIAAINGETSGGSQTITPLNNCKAVTWNGSATGGTSPYTYAWYIGTTLQGTGASLTKTLCGSQTVTLKLIVTDSASATDDVLYTTYFEPDGGTTTCLTTSPTQPCR